MRLQEAADLSAGDVGKRLADAINDQHRGSGQWGYYIDHFGDAESGDVIYSCDGDCMKAAYEMSGGEGAAAKTVIDFEGAEDVVPRTVYEPEQDEADHYAAMEEAGLYTRGPVPLCERFISKKEREDATSDDFAGKGKSFPILKPGDIMAAVRSIGRAGSGNLGPSGIKARIISIAKRKGWTQYLPKAWRGGDDAAKESRIPVAAGALKLTESATTLDAIVLREARADYEIKLIAPGKGSSAFYPAEVLKRDGPKVFQKSTHVYLNHPTAAEEAQRPEGDVANLAGVLTTDAVYHEAHAKGPGLYARMKVFADHAQLVEEKAPHVGMSIRASGVAEAGKMRDGVPVLKELTGAESVDVVTRAGAGGMILTEAAKAANPNEGAADNMDAAVEKELRESLAATTETNRKLLERAIRGDAREVATRLLAPLSLHEAAKSLVVDAVMSGEIPQKDGALDETKWTEAVNAQAKRVGAAFAAATGSGQVRGMGAAPAADPETLKAQEAAAEREQKRAVETYKRLGLSEASAVAAATGRVA